MMIFAVVWLSFAMVSTWWIGHRQEVTDSIWFQGMKAFPGVLVVFLIMDCFLWYTAVGERHPWLVLVALCVIGIALYVPGIVAVLWAEGMWLDPE
jgi:sugar phosphate permease